MFVLKLLKYSGFMPHIDSCIICLEGIEKRGSFSSERGGFICKKCERKDKSLKYPVSVGTIRSIWYIENNDLSNLSRLKLNSKIIEELNFILFNFLDYHISYKPNSLKFINAFL
jgi:DNA repair protein RecO